MSEEQDRQPGYLTRHQRNQQMAEQEAFRQGRINALKIVGGLIFVGTAVSLGIWRPWNTSPPAGGGQPSGADLRPTSTPFVPISSPNVDRKLIDELLDMERKYPRFDLSDDVLRSEHLELSAEVFARYGGELIDRRDLVGSIDFLPGNIYFAAHPTGSAAETHDDGHIFVNSEARLLKADVTGTLRREFPHWSSLSTARAFIYNHEWYHKAGITYNRVAEQPIPLDKYYQIPLDLTNTRGFSIRSKNRTKEEYGTDNSLEETFAYLMTGRLENTITGANVTIERTDHAGAVGEATNRGQKRFAEIFKRKPEWIGEFQRYHRESDPFGFGRFLVGQTNYLFQTEAQKEQYALDLLMSFTLSPEDKAYQDFLSRI